METPPPLYSSWEDYLDRTSYAERMGRCHAASKRANRVHSCMWRRKWRGRDAWSIKMRELTKDPCGHCGSLAGQDCLNPDRLTGARVWSIIEDAKGRCFYCNSLAVERRPSNPETGAPIGWEHVGRRIGSLEHVGHFPDGRQNHVDNLEWSCLWCNVHRDARIFGAVDHGGYHPSEIDGEDDEGDDSDIFPDHECTWDIRMNEL